MSAVSSCLTVTLRFLIGKHRRSRWSSTCAVILSAALVSLGATAQKPVSVVNQKAAVDRDYGKLPLSFEANRGQSDPQVRFVSRGSGYSLFLTDSAAVLSLSKPESAASYSGPSAKKPVGTDVVRMELAGASHDLHVAGDSQLSGTANYFIGNDPAKWQAHVPTYARVKYDNVYPGVDLIYYGNQRQLEYDFVVAPNADPKPIQLHFAGASRLKVDGNGDLEVIAKNGQITFNKPVLYQSIGGLRQPVEGSFRLLAHDTVAFQLGSYDHTRELVIDPTLSYSTYLGGSVGNTGEVALAVDTSGHVYLTGGTLSTDFPVSSAAFQKTNGTPTYANAYVTKLNAAGTAVLYSTYLGGSAGGGTRATGITLDSSGNAYLCGYTYSSNFPVTQGVFQPAFAGNSSNAQNAFVTKLNATGSALTYSSYLGGSGHGGNGDAAEGIAVNGNGDAYVAGYAYSTNFPTTTGAYQLTNKAAALNGPSVFLSKVNAAGSALVYSTYIGGSGRSLPNASNGPGDSATAVAIDTSGNAYIVGIAISTDFPVTSSAFQKTNKSPDYNAFATKVNANGTGLVFSTYLGGSGSSSGNYKYGDGALAVAVDATGDVYTAGVTGSSNFPVSSGAFQPSNKELASGFFDTGFLTELNSSGSALVYSTYLGGSGGADVVRGLAIDGSGNAYLTGQSTATNFPVTTDAFQITNKAASAKGANAFLSVVAAGGNALSYSTYLGGSTSDYGVSLAYRNGAVYLDGLTASTDFPTTKGAFQVINKAKSGDSNAFVAKFAFATASTTSLVTDGSPQALGVKVTFTADVTGAAGSGTPSGTVGFSVDGGTAVATTLDDTGHAAYSTATLAEGTHTITASYLGDATHLSSTSAKLTQTIYGAISTLTVVSGSGQNGPVNTAYSLPLVVVAKDAKGDVIPGISVTWSGTGLKFSSTTSVTGADGQASVTATPTTSGSLTAKATSGSLTASFTLTATNGTVATPTVTSTISIGEATAGATVYYTTNGTTPTTASTKYTGPITITASQTLKFIAVLPGDTSSAVRTVTTTIQ